VREAAAWVLDQLNDSRAIPALMGALHDATWSVRSAVGWALVHLGPAAQEAVRRVLRETQNLDAREMAEMVLARL
jgi:HEAT repeat protein